MYVSTEVIRAHSSLWCLVFNASSNAVLLFDWILVCTSMTVTFAQMCRQALAGAMNNSPYI